MPLYDLYTNRPKRNVSFHTGTTWAMLNNSRFMTRNEFNGVISGITTLMIGTHHEYTVPGFKAQKSWQNLPWEILWTKTRMKNLLA